MKNESLDVIKRNCPNCEVDNSLQPNSPYSRDPWIIKICSSCGFVYIDAAPDYKYLFEELDWDTTYSAERLRRQRDTPITYRTGQILRFRSKILPRQTVGKYIRKRFKNGNIVDLGCGGGGQIKDLIGAFTPYGVEISTKLAHRANDLFRQYGGYAVNASSLEGLEKFADDFFTAASLRSYLEHEMHPKPVLKALYRVLRVGGIAVVKVPNYASINRIVTGKNWCGFRWPDHLNYFTPESLRRMASDCGFECRFSFVGRLPTSDNMWAVLEK